MFKNKTSEFIKNELVKQLDASKELQQLHLQANTKDVQILYLKSICDEDKIQKNLILSFYQSVSQEAYCRFLDSLPGCKQFPVDTDPTPVNQLLRGKAAIFISEIVYFLDVDKAVNTEPEQATAEKTFQGPQDALSENIWINLNIIRHRYPSETLKIEEGYAGTLSKTPLLIVYDTRYVDMDVLEELKKRLANINVDVIQAAGELEKVLSLKKRSLFPTMMTTERPDRVAYNLTEGKVVVFIAGTPFTLIAPAVFFDFFSSMDDLYQSYWISRALLVLRYLGLFISITFPAVYISIVSYNPELFRVQLTVAIAGSRAAVPFPSYLEVLFMLLMMEMLTEASIRLPQAIGSTATTVGGLILGQASTQANIASSIMIIIVSAVAISNFVIPISSMNLAMRVARYPLIALATLFGFMGLVIGCVALLLYLTDLRSFGKPYLSIFMGSSKKIESITEETKS